MQQRLKHGRASPSRADDEKRLTQARLFAAAAGCERAAANEGDWSRSARDAQCGSGCGARGPNSDTESAQHCPICILYVCVCMCVLQGVFKS